MPPNLPLRFLPRSAARRTPVIVTLEAGIPDADALIFAALVMAVAVYALAKLT